jgi:eukaryotic-like serine/threonine-protein kinase
MISPENICPRCGSTVRGLSEGELCPACLLAACLDTAEESSAPGEEIDENWMERHGLEEAEAASGAGRRFGDYELFEEIGRGAMGFVRRARQVSLDRVVAIKFLLAGPLARPEAVRRFQAEAAAAALSHPGIVAIHEVGRRRHQHYLVMDYVSGTSLAKVVADGPLAAGRAARYVEAIAEAIHFAHEHGVLHRDLKPSNVLIDEEDRPRVTDFGLAKRLGVETGLTLSGQVMGSPGYLPPEQATGEAGKIGRPSDVYSLGAMLYHLLVGCPPFMGENPAEIIRQVVEREPTSPRLLLPSVPRDLETICLRCLEKEPARRYPTARALADELGRYLRGEAIQARPLGIIGRTVRWCRRKPAQAALTGSLGVAVALGLVSVLWGWSSTRQSFHREVEARQTAERALRQLEVQTARNFFANDQAPAGVALLAAMVRREPTDRALAEWLMAELTGRNWPLPAVRPLEHGEPVHHAEFSADGRRILTAALDNTVRLWHAETGLPMGMPLVHDRAAIQHPELFNRGQKCLQACFSPDGAKVATASVDGTARVWDGVSGDPLTPPLRHEDWVTAVGFNRDGSLIATGSRDGVVRRWNTSDGQPSGIGLELGAGVNFVEFSPDGERLLAGGDGGAARIWEVATGRLSGAPLRHEQGVRDGRFSPDGERVATASLDGTARLWNARTGEPLSSPLRHEAQVLVVRFSPDGARLATGSYDQTVRLWDGFNGAALGRPLEHAGIVRAVEFSPDGERLLTASEDRTVRIWEVRSGRLAMEPMRHAAEVWSARFSPDAQRIVTASSDRKCGVWDVRPGAARPLELPARVLVRALRWSPDSRGLVGLSMPPRWYADFTESASGIDLWSDGEVQTVEFSADGQWLVTGASDGGARVWDVAEGVVRLRVRHVGAVFSALFSGEGQRLLTASSDRTAVLWDVRTGQPLLVLRHPDQVRSAEFGAGEALILTTCADEQVRVWDGHDGRLRVGWRPHAGGLTVAQFSPDGTRVVTGSTDSLAQVWDATTGQAITESLQHRGVIRSVRFSPDGARLLTASQDGTARIWWAETGQPASAPFEHAAGVRVGAFSADGKRVVTASEDRTARIWDVATGQPLGSSLGHDGRVFDAAFSPDGRWVATACLRSVWIWPVPDGGDGVMPWLPDLAEAVGGLRQVKETTTEWVAAAAWFEVVERLRGWEDSSPDAVWRRWFLADRSTRPRCPGIGPRFQEDGEVGGSEAADAIAGMVNPRAEHRLPARDPALPSRLIDLSDYYNASLEEDWRASRFLSHNLSTVPRGRQVFDGIEYDIRGGIQLASELLELRGRAFDRVVLGIPVHQACRRLHLLHAADCVAPLEHTIAVFTIHRSDGSQDRLPIRYGIEALPWDWESGGGEGQAKVAWIGTSPAGLPVRLYRTTWTNACPEVKVETIDLESTGMRGAPFVVAITAEQ